MTMTMIPMVVDVLSTISKGLEKELEDLEMREQAESIQIKALLGKARILKRVLDARRDFLSLEFHRRPLATAGVTNSQRSK